MSLPRRSGGGGGRMSPSCGRPDGGLDQRRLSGSVDIRVRAADRQSFQGWFSQHPYLAAPHHPTLSLVLVHRPAGAGRAAPPGLLGRPAAGDSDLTSTMRPARSRTWPPRDACSRSADQLPRPVLVPPLPGSAWDTNWLPEWPLPAAVRARDTRGNYAAFHDVELVVRN